MCTHKCVKHAACTLTCQAQSEAGLAADLLLLSACLSVADRGLWQIQNTVWAKERRSQTSQTRACMHEAPC